MGKTNYLFKKIRDTKGTFHTKMGSIPREYFIQGWAQQGQKRYGPNKAEDIKKR